MRGRPTNATGWMLTFLTIAALAVPTVPAQQRVDLPSPFYVPLYFTWDAKEKTFGLAWEWDTPTTDPGGEPPPSGGLGSYGFTIDSHYYAQSGENRFPGPDVFTSPPAPRDLWLNVSRGIILQIYTWHEGVGPGCTARPTFEAKLEVDGKLLGGTLTGQSIAYPSGAAPPVPAYFCLVDVRLHPEQELVPKGSVLTLTLTHESQTNWFRYGTKGTHRSILSLPYYSFDELLYRNPTAALGQLEAETGPSSASGNTASLSLLAGLAAPGALLRSSRRGRATALVLCFAAAAFAGCAKPAEPAEEAPAPEDSSLPAAGTSRTTYHLDESGGDTSKGPGTIVGVVTDDQGASIPKAHVSLLETDRFADTNTWGIFTFRNVPAGEYTLRILPPTVANGTLYRPFRETIEVRAGTIARVDVVLASHVERPPGFRAHRHEYWGAATSKVLFDGSVAYLKTPFLFTIPAKGTNNEDLLVFPGTRELRVTLDWDAGTSLSRLGFYFRANHDKSLNFFSNFSYMHARERGEATNVQVAWEMADLGHQLLGTTWLFGIHTPAYEKFGVRDKADLQAYPATVQVRIEALKGIVPLEPAHPDLFRDADILRLTDSRPYRAHTWGAGCACAGIIVQEGVPGNPGYVYGPNMSWPTVRRVPVDTQWFEVTLSFNRDPRPVIDWRLYYKDAATALGVCGPPNTSPTPAMTNSGFRHATGPPAIDETGRNWTWRVPLADAVVDPAYAKTSTWCFFTSADHAQWIENCQTQGPCGYRYVGVLKGPDGGPTGTGVFVPTSPPPNLLFYNLTAVAHRDPWRPA